MYNVAFEHIANFVPLRKELKFRNESGVGIVANADTYKIEYLNESALMIFNLIDNKRTVKNICDAFLDSVEVSRQEFVVDLVETLRNFQWKKLITFKRM